MSDLNQVLNALTAAFDARDMATFKTMLKDDFTWVDVAGKVYCDSAEQFATMVEGYWADNPDLVSKLGEPIVVGNVVAQVEHITGWADGTSEQYLWVYEFDGHKLAKQTMFQPKA